MPTEHDSAAVAAIRFALETDEGLAFLRAWLHGDFLEIRREWPEAPQAIFKGAEALAEPGQLKACGSDPSDEAVSPVAARLAASVGLVCFVGEAAGEVEAAITNARGEAARHGAKSRQVAASTWDRKDILACMKGDPDVIVFPLMTDASHVREVHSAVRCGHLCITGSTDERLAREIADLEDVRAFATVVAA